MDKALRAVIIERLNELRRQTDADFWRAFADTPTDGLAGYNFGLGIFIRNNLLTQADELHALLLNAGITQEDDMSALIVRLWHGHLNEGQRARVPSRATT